MICKDLSICVASRTKRFWVWALGPKPEAFPRAACFTGHSQVQHPGICLHSAVVLKEDARPVHTEDTQDTE